MSTRIRRPAPTEKDPLWYKDAVVYELHVRAFMDSNGDGVGDFQGLTQKLDYLQDLGVTAIWLLPFYPSPLKDDGYDIADYFSINPMYGTLDDFKTFLDQAHQRHLRVITELVVNHTSDLHPWFQRARRAPPGSPWRDFYVWSDAADKYKEARIIFRDFEPSNWSWDPVARAYYWHRFYAHQPDLNYDNPQVHEEITRVLDFWLDMGVDGLRLDAVPYLYEREGTSCENLPETHAFLKKMRRHVDEKYGDRMLLGEANQWPEDAVAYFGEGKGDECHMAFHFPLMPRIFMAVRMEDRMPIVDILEQTPQIPETSQWAVFLRNHDELTLEMVTDEERDYMYRVYANDAKARINLGIRRRLAPLLGNDRKRIELLHFLLLSYPGTPFLYYGDEIGMGDNIFLGDRNGVRTPMQWSSDRNAGFSRASPHALYLPILLDPEYHYEAVNVEAQQHNLHSLWWWTKRLLNLRKRYRAFGRGSVKFIKPENRKILAFTRTYGDETILVVANLSRFSQPAKLDLSEFRQKVPVELFGRTEFPKIGEEPYFLTLNPHAAFWFVLQPAEKPSETPGAGVRDVLLASDHWEEVLENSPALERSLARYLRGRRWFGGKTREIKAVQTRDSIRVMPESGGIVLLVLAVEYVEGDPEEYLLPLGFAIDKEAEDIESHSPNQVLARLRIENGNLLGVLYEATGSPRLGRAFMDAMAGGRKLLGNEGEVRGGTLNGASAFGALEAAQGRAEQSNSALIYGDKYFLKLFRRVENGTNPDLEVGRFLTEKHFPNIPALAGWLEYVRRNGERLTVGILTEYLPNAKDAWDFTLDSLDRYFERIRAIPAERRILPAVHSWDGSWKEEGPPEVVVSLVGTYIESARLLGQRTAELHIALSSETENRDFTPEPFSPFYQRALFQSLRNLVVQNFGVLRRQLEKLPAPTQALAQQALQGEHEIIRRLRSVYETRLPAKRIHCHGDFHLGQVLYTGRDFIIIDFEGEPTRSLGERRIKRSPLQDVAGMIRSFDYASHVALAKQLEVGVLHEDNLPQIEPWAAFWYRWTSEAYLRSYLEVVKDTGLLPRSFHDAKVLLDAHMLGKLAYEVGYELNNRPAWVRIPLLGLLRLLKLPREEELAFSH